MDFHGDELFGRETMDDGPAMNGSAVPGAERVSGLAKMLLLGGWALDDLLRKRSLSDRDKERTGFVLNLSDHFVVDADARVRAAKVLPSVAWRQRVERLQVRLVESSQLRTPAAATILLHAGNAGIAAAIDTAATLMTQNKVDRCIVGAIDSRVEPSFLMAAARCRLLRTKDQPVGLIPGEAAAFFMLERPRDLVRSRTTALASVTAATSVQEQVDMLASEYVPTGEGLASAWRSALRSSPPVAFSIGDLNGWSQRAVEWGNAQLRLRAEAPVAEVPAWFPAISLGDTGAASGAVAICVAVRAFARHYAPGDAAMVWASSESGSKGAVVVRAPQ